MIGWLIASGLICFVCGWVSYQIGYSNGFTEALVYVQKYGEKHARRGQG